MNAILAIMRLHWIDQLAQTERALRREQFTACRAIQRDLIAEADRRLAQ